MKRRSDSVSSAIRAMANAAKPALKPPSFVELTESAMPFWGAVVCARARDEWTELDLVVAGQLAQCQADMAEEDATLRAEGKVIQNDRGTPVMNPRTAVMEQLARREMALMRTLRMGGAVTGNVRSEAGTRAMERQSKKLREELQDEELLAN